ncbi:MAG: hypothetical protein K2Y23_06340 [Cyanobacteria bacterium]|nr:hypothetical protein [Cyanobacteriota bacterium]
MRITALFALVFLSSTDWITVNTGAHASFALLIKGGFEDGCGWKAFAGNSSAPISLPNLVPSPQCPAEAIVSARGHAMQIHPIEGLTAGPQDRVTLRAPLSGARHLRVVVRVIDGALTDGMPLHFMAANQVFERCGIAFDAVYETPLLPPGSRVRLESSGCDEADDLYASAGRTRGGVNVYLLRERPHYRGAWCGNGESPYKDVVLLYRSASKSTLAHELGHAARRQLNLPHSDN